VAKGKDSVGGSLSLPADEMMQLTLVTLVTNEILGDDPTVNSYQVRNARALAKAKTLVLYKNGITKLPVSVKRLQADALAKGDHSLALSGNMQLARGEKQVPGTDAHHIVSRTHRLARYSRIYLFDWRIGIDDADNGVFLPAEAGANVPGLEKANAHDPIHTKLYHATVAARLLGRVSEDTAAGRDELRAMRTDMINGSFPYMKAR
jgi:hypothetical protein